MSKTLRKRVDELEMRSQVGEPKTVIRGLDWVATPEELAKIPKGALIVKMWQPEGGWQKWEPSKE